jgi:hypothetical protein
MRDWQGRPDAAAFPAISPSPTPAPAVFEESTAALDELETVETEGPRRGPIH